MTSTTYIFNQPGSVPGVPGWFANCTVTVDGQGNVQAINSLPQVPPSSSSVALVSPPSNTTANTDTPLTFAQQLSYIEVQNNSAFDVFVAYDQVATSGSLRLPPNAILQEDVQVTVVHVLTAAVTSINGTSQPNIYVGGTR